MTSIEDLQAWQRVVGATPDGKPGPKTFAATVAWFRYHGYIAPPTLPDAARERVVAIARGELGEQNPSKYYAEAAPIYLGTKPNEKSWCGVFALWCLRRAGLTDWTWKDGVGFVFDGKTQRLPSVSLPEPGDIAYFARNQHYAIVERVENGFVHTIDGNAKTTPDEGVETRRRPIGEAAAYYSIRRLVPA
jgi:hypothetical protein